MNILTEAARKDGAIGSSLEACVDINVPFKHSLVPHLQALSDSGDLSDALSVSAVSFGDVSSGGSDSTFHDKATGKFIYHAQYSKGGQDSIRYVIQPKSSYVWLV